MKSNISNISNIPFKTINQENKNFEPINDIELNSNINSDSDSDSDSDEYVDLSSKVIDDTEHIFQFHLNNNEVKLKYIGKSSFAPDIIIIENFGPESNMSIYNCVYSHVELESAKEEFESGKEEFESGKEELENDNNIELSNLFFPIIKLVVQNKIKNDENQEQLNEFIISSIAIKLNQKIEYEKQIELWELYWVQNIQSDNFIKTKKIEKNINSTNIIEKLIEYSLNI